ncbi:MarR family transcriptional regulator [Microbacterium fluvii]|nr:MarR family transcriptional regulator [Microbacterium fluvii]MCU4672985.1 MarR family transcriptional regulator [Microbacterium fluvii]
MSESDQSGEGYWYPGDESPSTSVLEALRAYRAAETAMRRRTRQSMEMGENELLVLRYLARAKRRGEGVTPVHLSRYLGITSASTTALLDRLVKSGHIARVPNPGDRRSILITSSEHAEEEIRQTLGAMHERMMSVVQPMTEQDRAAVISFLDGMRAAVDQIDG